MRNLKWNAAVFANPVTILLCVVFVVIIIILHINRRANIKLEILFSKTDPSADVRSQCMIREGFLEEPGIAQVLAGELYIWSVTGSEKRIPLDKIQLKKVRKTWLFGRYPWWWKTVFYLKTPQTSGLAIAVKEDQLWRSIFMNACR